jgi:hypothetical protein
MCQRRNCPFSNLKILKYIRLQRLKQEWQKSPAGNRQTDGKNMVWFGEIEKSSQIIINYFYLPFFILIILWLRPAFHRGGRSQGRGPSRCPLAGRTPPCSGLSTAGAGPTFTPTTFLSGDKQTPRRRITVTSSLKRV